MIMKNLLIVTLVGFSLSGCIVYDDGMPPAPRNYMMLYEARIGYPYTHHEHGRPHFMPERGPAGHPGAKHPGVTKPCVPSRGTVRRGKPATVR